MDDPICQDLSQIKTNYYDLYVKEFDDIISLIKQRSNLDIALLIQSYISESMIVQTLTIIVTDLIQNKHFQPFIEEFFTSNPYYKGKDKYR